MARSDVVWDLGIMTSEVVLDPAGIPALLSEALDVPRGEAVLGADLPNAFAF
jgi:hypothetical protein